CGVGLAAKMFRPQVSTAEVRNTISIPPDLPPDGTGASRYSRQSAVTPKANGARAVLGSQQPLARKHDRTDFTLPMQSDALRAQDGSRSGGSVERRQNRLPKPRED